MMYANDVTITSTTGQSTLNLDLLTETVSGWLDVSAYRSASVQLIGSAGISAGAVIFEQTNDITNAPNGVSIPSVDATSGTSTATTTAITVAANAVLIRNIPNLVGRFFRVRISTGFVGGTVRIAAVFSSISTVGSQAVTAAVTGATVTGTVAEDAAATAVSPVMVGAFARTGLPATTVIAGDAVRLTSSTSGQLIFKQFAPRDLDFFVNTTVTTAVQTALRAAQGANVIQNVTQITFQNTSATATTLTIQDGNNTLITISCPASMSVPSQLVFPTPLFGTANAALNYTAGTAGANILLNVTGYNSY